ncbi:unnamed protein product [Cylicocyclus nassatus]|uniref:UDP-glucuronosyltransferase n=1 Tax=Cylicocyclus nassatus TaxID=53992 RepID=A0AA36GC56_CYLNA|nr:unnamed protein product [Cylicocyclus nassatus]
MRQLLLLSLSVFMSDAGKVLMYSPGISYSHLIANGRIADALVKAGHDVVMFIPEYAALGNFTGTKLARVIRMDNISSDAEELLTEEEQRKWMERHHTPLSERYDYESVYAKMCEALMARRSEIEVLKNYGFDVAFTEQLDFCGVGVVRYLGIHNLLWLSSTTIMDAVSYDLGIPSPTSYVPSIEENDMGDTLSFWERAHNIFLYLASLVIHRHGTDLITEVFRKFDKDFPNVRDIAANSSLCFVNTDEMFDLPRPIIHKTIYIGGLGMREPQPLNKKFSSLMSKGNNGVIIFSMGSVAAFHAFPDRVKTAFAKVIQSFPDYHFIVKIAQGDITTHSLFEEVSNCDLVEWLPQADLLAHPRVKLFIMHGGVNGILEALTRAVPVIVIPVYGDQYHNGRAAEKRGVGKVLLRQDLNENSIRMNIKEMLEDERYKKNAIRLSKLMREKPFSAEERLIQWTNFAISNGVLKELHLEGSRLNFIVYFNLDVVAAVIAAVLVFAGIVFMLGYVLVRSISPIKRKQE